VPSISQSDISDFPATPTLAERNSNAQEPSSIVFRALFLCCPQLKPLMPVFEDIVLLVEENGNLYKALIKMLRKTIARNVMFHLYPENPTQLDRVEAQIDAICICQQDPFSSEDDGSTDGTVIETSEATRQAITSLQEDPRRYLKVFYDYKVNN
jgi:hypothetical protein